jgi:hypothetical protein
MLRTILLWLGAVLLAGGLSACLLTATLAGLAPAIVGLVLVVALLIERRGYKPIQDQVPGPDWQNTGETFLDPNTGMRVAVYFQPSTGKRVYVRAGPVA